MSIMFRISRPSGCVFCPFCGCPNIRRDKEMEGLKGSNRSTDAADWLCNVCFAGWRMHASRRVQLAAALHSDARAERPPDNLVESPTK